MMAEGFQFEVCANSVESAIEAQKGGACRVELCAGIPEGGTTPSFGEIAIACKLLAIRLHVIIRPRGGDFLYSPVEQEIMLEDIRNARRAGADGVVFGCLTADGEVDVSLMKKLMEAAQGMSVTFHRAFDMCRDASQALEDIIALGCDRILTSGGMRTAEEGIPRLKVLQEQAAGRITIMPGCGIRAANIAKIAQGTGCREFHFSARSPIESRMIFRNPSVSMGGTVHIDEYAQERTDAAKVTETIRLLEG